MFGGDGRVQRVLGVSLQRQARGMSNPAASIRRAPTMTSNASIVRSLRRSGSIPADTRSAPGRSGGIAAVRPVEEVLATPEFHPAGMEPDVMGVMG